MRLTPIFDERFRHRFRHIFLTSSFKLCVRVMRLNYCKSCGFGQLACVDLDCSGPTLVNSAKPPNPKLHPPLQTHRKYSTFAQKKTFPYPLFSLCSINLREALFWNVLVLYGHCPNSFRPPPLSVNGPTWKKSAPNHPSKALHPWP